MKWDEMSPRERDALVAEKVMGWTDIETRQTSAWGKPDDFDASDPVVNVPEFTLDISAAWEVVQKLKPTHSFELRVGKYAESARFTQQLGVGDGSEFIAQREHAPESICLAALRAMGVDV